MDNNTTVRMLGWDSCPQFVNYFVLNCKLFSKVKCKIETLMFW